MLDWNYKGVKSIEKMQIILTKGGGVKCFLHILYYIILYLYISYSMIFILFAFYIFILYVFTQALTSLMKFCKITLTKCLIEHPTKSIWNITLIVFHLIVTQTDFIILLCY